MFFTDAQLKTFKAALDLGILPPRDRNPQGALDSKGGSGMSKHNSGMHGDGVYVWRDGKRYRAVLEPDVALDGKRRRRLSHDEIQDWIREKLGDDDYAEYMRRLDAQNDIEPDGEDSIEDVEPMEVLTEDSASAFRESLLVGMDQAMGHRAREAEDYARKFPDAMRVRIAEDRKPVGGPSDPGVMVVTEPGGAQPWRDR
jgi:hypothetical protein